MTRFLRTTMIAMLVGAAGPTYAADLLIDPPAPPIVQEEPVGYGSGYVEGRIGTMSSRDNKKDEDLWALRGSHAVNFGTGFAAQGDLRYGNVSSCCVDDDTLSGTIHLFKRDPNKFAFGVYGHMAKETGNNDKEEDLVTGGLEAAAFLGNVTLMGHVGLGSLDTANNSYDYTRGGIAARYYATENIRFDATLDMDHTELTNASQSSTHFGLQGNWRMDHTPVSLFAGYRYEREHLDVVGANLQPTGADVIYAGARFHWGSKSLIDEERTGTLWDYNGAVGD